MKMKDTHSDGKVSHLIASSVIANDSQSSTVYDKLLQESISSKGNHLLLQPPSELSLNLFGDVLVACGVTFGLAPFVSVIDKSIVQRAAGTHTVFQSCTESVKTMLRNPIGFVKSPMFLMMWGVYAATYSTANCLKTIVKHQEESKSKNSNSNKSNFKIGPFGVFASTTIINSTATMMKDSFYAKNFGTTSTIAKIPLVTYTLWGLRDCMVIGSAFVLPDIVCTSLQQQTNLDEKTALKVSQLSCPVIAQLFAGPTQLLGLDIYNRPLAELSYSAAIMERIRFQYLNFTSIVGVRIARIAPAYGIGGVCNTYVRDCWRMKIIGQTDQ